MSKIYNLDGEYHDNIFGVEELILKLHYEKRKTRHYKNILKKEKQHEEQIEKLMEEQIDCRQLREYVDELENKLIEKVKYVENLYNMYMSV